MSMRTKKRAITIWEVLDNDETVLANFSFEPGSTNDPAIEFRCCFAGEDGPDMCLSVKEAENMHEALGAAISAAKAHKP